MDPQASGDHGRTPNSRRLNSVTEMRLGRWRLFGAGIADNGGRMNGAVRVEVEAEGMGGMGSVESTRRLLAAAEGFLGERAGEVIALTSALVAAPSPNLPGDETAAAAVIERAGALRVAPGKRPGGGAAPAEPDRPHRRRSPGPHLALCGHLDTKPVGDAADEWRTDPFAPTIEGDRLFGLGSTDMKGACAAMVLAGAAFARVADQATGSLSLIFTADEEYGSHFGASYLVRSGALDVDAILLGEPAGMQRTGRRSG